MPPPRGRAFSTETKVPVPSGFVHCVLTDTPFQNSELWKCNFHFRCRTEQFMKFEMQFSAINLKKFWMHPGRVVRKHDRSEDISSNFEKHSIWRFVHTFSDTSSDKKHEISHFLQHYWFSEIKNVFHPDYIPCIIIQSTQSSPFLIKCGVLGPNAEPSLPKMDRFENKSKPFRPSFNCWNFKSLHALFRVSGKSYLRWNKNKTKMRNFHLKFCTH